MKLNYFGVLEVRDAERIARGKFRECPWPHFDGVPDPVPNRVVAADVAVTIVMNSGTRANQIWPALERASAVHAERLLARIPTTMSLEDTTEQCDPVPWTDIDRLFTGMAGPKFRMSRVAKTLCRKRPRLIPMLDSVVWKFLNEVHRGWRRGTRGGPAWFDDALWNRWKEGQPSPYIRMIREDMRAQRDTLAAIRDFVVADPRSEVPSTASLLRIYEAILWRVLV